MMARKPNRYTPPTRYTPEELAVATISDLVVDIACAHRDNQPEYAAYCEVELDLRKADFRARFGTEPTLLPYAVL